MLLFQSLRLGFGCLFRNEAEGIFSRRILYCFFVDFLLAELQSCRMNNYNAADENVGTNGEDMVRVFFKISY